MNRPDFYCASDYAGMTTREASFYYGYEVVSGCGDDEEWCFQAQLKNNVTINIKFSELGCKDQFDVVACLMMGIGWVLARYSLELQQ